jgi:hypothetical protein
MNTIKYSHTISRDNAELKTNVSETRSVFDKPLIQRLLVIPHIDPDDGDRASLRNVGF